MKHALLVFLFLTACGTEYPYGYMGGNTATHEIPSSPPIVVSSPIPSPTPTHNCYEECWETEHHYICDKNRGHHEKHND